MVVTAYNLSYEGEGFERGDVAAPPQLRVVGDPR